MDIETFVIGAVVGAVVGALAVYWLGRRRRSGYPALWRRGAAPNGHGASVQWVDGRVSWAIEPCVRPRLVTPGFLVW